MIYNNIINNNKKELALIVKSYAKINLSLIVKGRRPDGFHELDMLIQNIDLCDIITIARNEGGLRLSSNLSSLSLGEDNLVHKAARLMIANFKLDGGFDIHIEKHIPVAAGLGGGSSNAASVMKAIIELCDIKVKQTKLDEIALELGTEVVYFLRSGLCRVRGKGDIVETINFNDENSYLLINPSRPLSTKEVYSSLSREDYHPDDDNDAMLDSILKGEPYHNYMRNDMERAAIARLPLIQEIMDGLRSHGFSKIRMSGSGPSVFALIEEEADVEAALSLARERGYRAYVCSAVKGV